MGSTGKSALARAVYNHPDVAAAHFDCRGWVVVSSEFNPQETIKQLILQMPRSKEDKQKLRELENSMKDPLYLQEKLQEMLHQQLQGKTYFIVLDDVWEDEHWESLGNHFPDEQDKKSRLLITTRNKVIAKHSHYAAEMKVLDLDNSWELFLKKAFNNNSDGECPEELEHIGRKIVEKCNGLPLAISVVGGLLMETRRQSGWEGVLNQINSHVGRAESSISTILELSYQNLSPLLKACFLSLAIFKEDASIPTKRLVHVWVGQGLIQQEGTRTVEEIGRGYLDELINRNMVQVKRLTLDDRVKSCHLHDLFRDLCLRKAEEEIGLQMVKGDKGTTSYNRHRVVYDENLEALPQNENHHLGSLFLLNVRGGVDDYVNVSVTTTFRYWKSFQLLEILYLEGVGFRSFPHSFRSLIVLKYLRIRCGSPETIKLPSWLDHLEKLQVLDASSEDVELPDVSLKMDRLRYFSALRIYGLTSIDDWRNIETLKYMRVDDFMKCSSRLSACCSVRQLGLFLDRSSEGVVLSEVKASLEKMEKLVKLQLIWDLSLSIEPAMIPRLDNLTRIKLRGGMTRCPNANMFPPNLCQLTLEESFLEEDPTAELSRLPKLVYLKLSSYAYLGERMRVLHDGFPCLKGLSLRDIYFLSGIDVEEGGMPHLKQLRIRRCPALCTQNLPHHVVVSSE